MNLFEPIINSLDNAIHKSNLKDSFIDDFIHDLQRYMLRQNLDYDYSRLPKNTIFEMVPNILPFLILIQKNLTNFYKKSEHISNMLL